MDQLRQRDISPDWQFAQCPSKGGCWVQTQHQREFHRRPQPSCPTRSLCSQTMPPDHPALAVRHHPTLLLANVSPNRDKMYTTDNDIKMKRQKQELTTLWNEYPTVLAVNSTISLLSMTQVIKNFYWNSTKAFMTCILSLGDHWNNTVSGNTTSCPHKKVPLIFCCNFYKYRQIFMIFRAKLRKRMPKYTVQEFRAKAAIHLFCCYRSM